MIARIQIRQNSDWENRGDVMGTFPTCGLRKGRGKERPCLTHQGRSSGLAVRHSFTRKETAMISVRSPKSWLPRSAAFAAVLSVAALVTPAAEASGLVQFRIRNNTHATASFRFIGSDGSTLLVDALKPGTSKFYSMRPTNARWTVGPLPRYVRVVVTCAGVTRTFTVSHLRSYRLNFSPFAYPPLRLIDVGAISIP